MSRWSIGIPTIHIRGAHLHWHISTPVGFEPTRGDPIGLTGRRLSHSAKVSSATQRTNQKHTHTHDEGPLALGPRLGGDLWRERCRKEKCVEHRRQRWIAATAKTTQSSRLLAGLLESGPLAPQRDPKGNTRATCPKPHFRAICGSFLFASGVCVDVGVGMGFEPLGRES